MRKIFLFLSLLISIGVSGQNINVNKVPENIVIEFDKRFPDALVERWEQVSEGILVSFINKEEQIKTLFSQTGEWVYTFTEVSKNEMPENAIAYFTSNYANKGFQITKYGFSQQATGRSYYQLDLTSPTKIGKITELHFGIAGNYMSSKEVDAVNKISEETGIKGVTAFKPVKISALPEKITSLLRAEYKDFPIKQTASISAGDYQGGYYVVLRKKERSKSVELFFDKFSSIKDKIEPEEAISVEDDANVTKKEFNHTLYKWPAQIKAKELPSPIIDYIKTNYFEHNIIYSTQLSHDELPDIYHIKIKKRGEKNEIELYFDLYGKLLKKIEPIDVGLGNTGNGSDDYTDENVPSIKPNTVISARELPSSANWFIKNNYKEYSIKKTMFISNDEMQNVYFVEIKKQAEPSIELYFDFTGSLISNNDELWKQKQEEAALLKATTKPKLTQNDIPEIIYKNFTKKNPKAANIEWEKVDNDYLARYTLNELQGRALYTTDGTWVMTASHYDKNRLSNVIRTYISQNYGSYKIDYSMQIQRADKKNYYSVVISRKIKGGREYTGLKFNNSGKFIDIDEDVNPENGEQ